ncbi:MAG: DUF3363 domain-containing protein [Parvibaculum sp.]|nr:DUF3363 domain-containing protein [Parvibaculum sp.]
MAWSSTYELDVAKALINQARAEYRDAVHQRIRALAGIYRRSVILASGRYAMLDDGMGFSLVPWKPLLEQRLGQTIMATLWRGNVVLELGRQRGTSIS